MSKRTLALEGIRKQWFIVGLAYALMGPVLLSFFVSFIGNPNQAASSWVITWMVINTLSFLIFFKCAARRGGKKLLTLFLLITPLTQFAIFLQLCGIQLAGSTVHFMGLIFDYTEKFNSHLVSYQMQGVWTLKLLFVALSYFVLFGVFYYLSLRLRRENDRLQSEKETMAPEKV
jgi:hypothetical protein